MAYPPVEQIRLDAMAVLRRDGWTLDEIGRAWDISRERVRQLMERIGLDGQRPRSEMRRERDNRLVEMLMSRPCGWPNCEKEIGSTRRNQYCEKHSREAKRYMYPAYTEEQRLRHRRAVKAWQKAHPAAYREIQQRSNRAYRARQKAKAS